MYRCPECGHDHDKVDIKWYAGGMAECPNCGNVWRALHIPSHHGISEQAWEYADLMEE